MYVSEQENQMTCSNQFFHPDDDPIPDDHPYLILINELPWNELLTKFEDFLNQDKGRPSIPVKHMIFLLLIKHKEGYSDREGACHC